MKQPSRSELNLLPSGLILLLFFFVPLGYFLTVSFWRLKSYRLVPDFTLANYANALSEYGGPLVFTSVIGFIIAAITTVLGFLIAYLARFRAGNWGQMILFVVLLTLFGGYLVKIFAWKTILGTQGILNNALLELGLIAQPLGWLLYSPIAVVITLVHFLLPFTVLPIYGALRGLEDTPISAARDLGATPARILWDVILPQCQSGLFAGFAIAFLVSVGDYVTPRLVGGPNTFMVGNFVESQFMNRLNAPMGSALSVVMLLAAAAVLIAMWLVMRYLLRPR